MSGPSTPDDAELAALRREADELRAELADIRASRSFRLGHAVMRTAARVVPGRRAGTPPRGATSAAPASAATGSSGPPAGSTGQRPSDPFAELPLPEIASVGPHTPDDVLIDAARLPSGTVAELLAGWRDHAAPHARLLVAHPDAERLVAEVADHTDPPWPTGRARAVAVPGGTDLDAARVRFGPARTLQPGPDGTLPPLPELPDRGPLVPALDGLPAPDATGLPAGPVFVGGTGRSGTWVIGRMLRHHPRWHTVHTELRFHSVPGGFPRVLAGAIDPERFAARVHEKWFRIAGGSGNAKGLQIIAANHEVVQALKHFRATADRDLPLALGRLMQELIAPYARGRGAAGWTETTPYNASAAHALLTALPAARLVHTLRDGRDVASSVTSMPWGPDSIEEALDWWAARVLQASRGVRAADPARTLTVRLEELIHLERDASYHRVLDFLGVDDHPKVRAYFDERIDSRRGNVGRWRQQVSAGERDRIDGRYRELLAELAERGMDVLPTEPERVDELAGG